MINFNCFALSAVDDSVAETTKKAKAFFSRDNLTELFNEAVKWTADKIFQIILSLILWKVGKHVMKWLLKICSKALERAGFENGVIKFINSVLRFVCYAVMVMMVLDILGFQTASLIAVFGSAALALSMSLQGSLANFAGGILILITKPFALGDYIIAEGVEGNVAKIDIIYTTLQSIDNKSIKLPNGKLADSVLTNVTHQEERRLDVEVGIGYDDDIKKAKKIMADVMKKSEYGIKPEEEVVVVKELADSSIILEMRMWVKTEDYWNAKFYLNENVKYKFDENNISIPFNQLDVNLKNVQ